MGNCRPDSRGLKVAGMVANADQEIVEALESFGWEVEERSRWLTICLT